MELERIQSRLSHEALGFFIRLRTEAMIRETDGLVEDAVVSAIAAYFGTAPARTRRLLHELEQAGALVGSPRGVTDIAFATWCRLKTERDQLRLQWAQQQRRVRGTDGGIVPLPSGAASGDGSGTDTSAGSDAASARIRVRGRNR